jgi:hypothetical protein
VGRRNDPGVGAPAPGSVIVGALPREVSGASSPLTLLGGEAELPKSQAALRKWTDVRREPLGEEIRFLTVGAVTARYRGIERSSRLHRVRGANSLSFMAAA